MKSTGDSLSGQNRCRRVAGDGSSPSLPVLSKSQKTKLWQRLRRYDRKVEKLNIQLDWHNTFCNSEKAHVVMVKLENADLTRKLIRDKLKGY